MSGKNGQSRITHTYHGDHPVIKSGNRRSIREFSLHFFLIIQGGFISMMAISYDQVVFWRHFTVYLVNYHGISDDPDLMKHVFLM